MYFKTVEKSLYLAQNLKRTFFISYPKIKWVEAV